MGAGSKPSIVAVITCRSKSSRLPDKFKADICGKPMLLRIVESVRKSKVDNVIVAGVEGDSPVIDFCLENKIGLTTGKEKNILGRVYKAASLCNPDIVVRIWGDSPLIRPEDIDFALDYFKKVNSSYLVSYTEGGAIAIMLFAQLKKLNKEVTNPEDREWLHKYQSQQSSAIRVDSGIPLTVDTLEDLERVREIVSKRS